MTIQIDHAAFRTGTADVRAGAESLRATCDDLHRDVAALLDGGWTGAAARSYADAWADWRHGADEVLAALAAMARLLDAVHIDLSDRDVDIGVDVGDIATRITGRLGG